LLLKKSSKAGRLRAKAAGRQDSEMNWYLRKQEGETYGPVDLPTLQLWATDSRVNPNDLVSQDRETWRLASEIPELGLDWVVEMRDGSEFGPVHVLQVRDFVQDGSVSRRAMMTNVRTQDKVVVSEALAAIFSGLSTHVLGIVSAGKLEREQAGASGAEERARLEGEVRRLTEQLEHMEAEVAQWKKQYEETARAAEVRASELKARSSEARTTDARVEGLRAELEEVRRTLEEERAVARKREDDLKKQLREAKAQWQSAQELQQQVEKWKTLYEHSKKSGRAETTAAVESVGDMVPRARLEEVERRLAQVQRSYQQVMRALNRNLAPDGGHPPASDQLRRSQVS
jgi:archaellum component FlaC